MNPVLFKYAQAVLRPYPSQGPPRLRPFDTEEFLHTVEHSGPQLTSGIKGDWEGLYRWAALLSLIMQSGRFADFFPPFFFFKTCDSWESLFWCEKNGEVT